MLFSLLKVEFITNFLARLQVVENLIGGGGGGGEVAYKNGMPPVEWS